MCNPNMFDMYNESWLQDHGFDEPQPLPFEGETQDIQEAIHLLTPDIEEIGSIVVDANLENIEETIDNASIDLEQSDTFSSGISCPGSVNTIDEASTDLEQSDSVSSICTEFTQQENAILSNSPDIMQEIDNCLAENLENINPIVIYELLKEEDTIDEAPTDLERTDPILSNISSPSSCISSSASLESIDSNKVDELLKEEDTIDEAPTNLDQTGRAPLCISSAYSVNSMTTGSTSLENGSVSTLPGIKVNENVIDSSTEDKLLKVDTIDANPTDVQQSDASSSSNSSAGNLDSPSSEDIAAENSITADTQSSLECVENANVKGQDLSQTRKRKAGVLESSMPAAKKAKLSTASLPEDIDPSEPLNAADEAPTYLEHSDASSSSISSIDTDDSTSPNGAAQPSASLPEKTDKVAVRRRNNNIASRNYRTLRQQRKQELFAREQELLNSNAQLNAQAQQLAHEIEPYIKVIFIYLVVLIVFQVRYGSTI